MIGNVQTSFRISVPSSAVKVWTSSPRLCTANVAPLGAIAGVWNDRRVMKPAKSIPRLRKPRLNKAIKDEAVEKLAALVTF